MKDYKNLINKLDKQREVDLANYEWDDRSPIAGLLNAIALLSFAAFFMYLVVSWCGF
jgi:hypothetical protein